MKSIRISLLMLKYFGFWISNENTFKNKLYQFYGVCVFISIDGIYIIIQVIDLFKIWGNLPMMTGAAFLLFTILAQATKIINVMIKKQKIQSIIDDGNLVLRSVDTEDSKRIVQSINRETALQQVFYFFLTAVTVLGWALSAEKNQLPLRAWYPYDASKSPAFELTYCHQVGALFVAAFLNVAKDSMVTALTAQCRCRLQLVNLRLRKIHDEFDGDKNTKTSMLSPEEECKARRKLRVCVKQHQAALQAVTDVQECFSAPTFAQFTVSLVIICVTAFQLTNQLANPMRFISMTTYLFNMVFQVFLYCYQGEQLREVSTEVADAAYECSWYRCSLSFRRCLLNLMVRSRRPAVLNAGGFTNLSLQSFTSIIKASYSFFTVLKQVETGV